MILNGAAIRAASIGYQAHFLEGWEKAEPHWPRWASQVDSTGDSEEYHFDDGLPQMREWLGDRQRKNLRRYVQTLRNRTWELTVSVRRELYEDDKLGLLGNRFRSMGLAARNHPDVLLGDLLEAGFADDGFDEVVFFSADHASGTNLVADSLDTVAFNLAIQQMRSQTTAAGEPIDIFALGGELELMVGPDLEGTARALLLAQFAAGGANNMDYGRAKLRVNPRIATGRWYLGMVGTFIAPFLYQERRKPQVLAMDQPGDDASWNRNEVEYGVDGRWAMGYGHHQLIQGGTG